MSNVYQEKPNIVTIQITDDTGTAERFVVGKTLDEVLSIIQPEAPVAGRDAKKPRKARRSRSEMTRAEAETRAGEVAMRRLKESRSTEDHVNAGEDVPPPHDKPKKDLWP